jgi:hypothetical protein
MFWAYRFGNINVLFQSLPTIATVIFIIQLIHFNIWLFTKQLQGGLSFNRFRVQSQRLARAAHATASAADATATATGDAVSVTVETYTMATARGRSSAQHKAGCI